MITEQTLADFAPALTEPHSPERGKGGYFAAVRLDDFSAESMAATKVYSRKDFFKISLITGHATYHYRDQKHLFEPGGCALVFTNQETPYRWEVHSGTCSGYACMFTADFLPLHTHLRPSNWSVFDPEGESVFHLSAEERISFTGLFQKMIDEQKSGYAHKYDLLFLYVLECIHQALKLQPELELRKQTAATRITEAFKALLADQFPLVVPTQQLNFRNPQAFADQLSVHTNHLNRAIKSVTGKTTTRLITERIMQEARALLLYSDWSVSQISYSLGFDEPTHFTKAFRQHTGQTPSALRLTV